ncbi:MAG TPA: VWA domain-containing protein [Pyrinomonadaceae bacterium]|nr:VWA domain-containing protein [Pyrinomonadaceae bacterium]
MNTLKSYRRLSAALASLALLAGLVFAPGLQPAGAQSRRLPPNDPQKKNQRPEDRPNQPQTQPTPAEPLPQDIVKEEAEAIKVETALVNVETVVYHKKTGKVMTGLTKANFALFEDGVQKEITNFSTPEAPITVAVVLEYTKLAQLIGYYGSSGHDYTGMSEILTPTAMFLTQLVRPPHDYATVIAYDMRPTPLTDFTNDPGRLNSVISLLLRNRPVSSEANLFDALKLALIGGRADSVVLENSEQRSADYAGISSVQNRRRAVFLVTTGIDTFSKINYGEMRKIAQNAGVPIYIIGTGNLFMKKYGDQLEPTDGLLGATTPGRMTFLQAQNTLKTFAKETGGEYFPMTFVTEMPSYLQTINAMMRSQYSLGYRPSDLRDGKQHKLLVKVDVDGDGQYDDKEYVVRSRQFYNAPKS